VTVGPSCSEGPVRSRPRRIVLGLAIFLLVLLLVATAFWFALDFEEGTDYYY
jgi:flagellar biosynthesis/type III secretory pathway M-ring protein FliF/YscJ